MSTESGDDSDAFCCSSNANIVVLLWRSPNLTEGGRCDLRDLTRRARDRGAAAARQRKADNEQS
jgi:hypothetical protein